jgi:hypothetical protein
LHAEEGRETGQNRTTRFPRVSENGFAPTPLCHPPIPSQRDVSGLLTQPTNYRIRHGRTRPAVAHAERMSGLRMSTSTTRPGLRRSHPRGLLDDGSRAGHFRLPKSVFCIFPPRLVLQCYLTAEIAERAEITPSFTTTWFAAPLAGRWLFAARGKPRGEPGDVPHPQLHAVSLFLLIPLTAVLCVLCALPM